MSDLEKIELLFDACTRWQVFTETQAAAMLPGVIIEWHRMMYGDPED